jgi:hypothetical protein
MAAVLDGPAMSGEVDVAMALELAKRCAVYTNPNWPYNEVIVLARAVLALHKSTRALAEANGELQRALDVHVEADRVTKWLDADPESRTAEAIAAWLEASADRDDNATWAAIAIDAAGQIRAGNWRKP